jgi:DNA-binding LytR/AlgR family response regulator
MNCIIIEDQPPAQRILKKYIQDTDHLVLTGVFSDAIQAMAYLTSEPVELMFLDIHLPKLSGLEFLKAHPHPPHVILTTAFSDYALESYEFNVVDYLLKPFAFARFLKAVSKVPSARQPDPTQAKPAAPVMRKELYLKSGHEYIRVVIDDILFIKSDGDYTELHTAEKRYLSAEPLRHWLESLDQGRFVQVHKSYIVHTAVIQKIVGNQIYLNGQSPIPIGRAYKDQFVNNLIYPKTSDT